MLLLYYTILYYTILHYTLLSCDICFSLSYLRWTRCTTHQPSRAVRQARQDETGRGTVAAHERARAWSWRMHRLGSLSTMSFVLDPGGASHHIASHLISSHLISSQGIKESFHYHPSSCHRHRHLHHHYQTITRTMADSAPLLLLGMWSHDRPQGRLCQSFNPKALHCLTERRQGQLSRGQAGMCSTLHTVYYYPPFSSLCTKSIRGYLEPLAHQEIKRQYTDKMLPTIGRRHTWFRRGICINSRQRLLHPARSGASDLCPERQRHCAECHCGRLRERPLLGRSSSVASEVYLSLAYIES